MRLFCPSRKGCLLLSFFLTLIFLAFSACAVRTTIPEASLSDISRNSKYKTIVFKQFTAVPYIAYSEGPLAECRANAISYLRSKNVFTNVEDDKGVYDNSTLLVEANLTFLRIVSRAARFWGWWFVGRSTMIMDVKLIDSSTGAVIAKQELVGAPNAGASAWTFGNTDQTLPTKMGWLVGDFILANVSKR